MTRVTEADLFPMPPAVGAGSDVNAAGPDACIRCGRPIKNPEEAWMIELVFGGDVACLPGQGDPDHPGYMGWHPIGPECAKRIPERFRFRHSEWKDHFPDT